MDVWAALPQPSCPAVKGCLAFQQPPKGEAGRESTWHILGNCSLSYRSRLGFVSWRGCSVVRNILKLTDSRTRGTNPDGDAFATRRVGVKTRSG